MLAHCARWCRIAVCRTEESNRWVEAGFSTKETHSIASAGRRKGHSQCVLGCERGSGYHAKGRTIAHDYYSTFLTGRMPKFEDTSPGVQHPVRKGGILLLI
ncbi:hypothetical protein CDAR_307261 [Caerostris darwini]|uniref:Uncharacterized protein n=1 Tax=Caerostris darwini TaxID=1538125 RepID=A0AAV4WJN2_9ARAC|nr:hypothetical protein CDAR_307261 [Caerostris darwini]